MASVLKSAKESKCENRKGSNWLELPRDVTRNILQRLGVIDIVMGACQVCPLWWNICKDPLLWRSIDLSNHRTSPYDLAKVCMYAIDRSCGLLEDISIEYFGSDELLKYLTDRTCDLRRIRLAKSVAVSDKVLIDVANKFSMLEELELSFNNLSKDSLEAIGTNCPLLKTLKYNRPFKGTDCSSYRGFKSNDEAFVIAKKMPQLRHLQIWGNKLTNDGLIAILDGCRYLESLDMRYCYNVVLRGGLGKRCYEQIKDLRPPNEHIDEYDDDKDDFVYAYYCECPVTRGKTQMKKLGMLF